MKNALQQPWPELFGITAIALALFGDADLAEKVQLSMVFTNHYIYLNSLDIGVCIFVISKITALTHVFSYQVIFKMKWHGELRNSFSFMMMLFLKYHLPFFLMLVTTIDGYSFSDAMPITAGLIKILLIVAMLMDTVIFLLNYSEQDVVTVRFAGRVFVFPFKRDVRVISYMIWTLVTCSLSTKAVLRVYEQKNITSG